MRPGQPPRARAYASPSRRGRVRTDQLPGGGVIGRPTGSAPVPPPSSAATPPTCGRADSGGTDVMFTAGPSDASFANRPTTSSGLSPKRKLNFDNAISHPHKMRIIEEKLSASLQDMHISGQTKTNPEQIETPSYSQQTDDNEMDITTNESSTTSIIGFKTINPESQRKLVMCEELRNLNVTDPIVFPSLLNFERPSNALLVWKPQPWYVHLLKNEPQ